MNVLHLPLALALCIALAAIVVACVCVRLAHNSRRTTADCIAVALQLEGECADLSRDLDTATVRATDLSRRVAWLESRTPRPSKHPSGSIQRSRGDDAAQTFQLAARTGITERRHRVMRLAKRGEDVPTIAGTLGMPPGEVELIINLNTVA